MRKSLLAFALLVGTQFSAHAQYGANWVANCNKKDFKVSCENKAQRLNSYSSGTSFGDTAKYGSALGAAMSQNSETRSNASQSRNDGKPLEEWIKSMLMDAYEDDKLISNIPLYKQYAEAALNDYIKQLKRLDEDGDLVNELLRAYVTKIEFLFDMRPEKMAIEKNPRAAYRLLEDTIEFEKKLEEKPPKRRNLRSLSPKLYYYQGLALLNGNGTKKNVEQADTVFLKGGVAPYQVWANDQNRNKQGLKKLSKLDSSMDEYIIMSLCASASSYINTKKSASWLEDANENASLAGRMMARSDKRNYGAVCDSISELTNVYKVEQASADATCKKETDKLCDLPV